MSIVGQTISDLERSAATLDGLRERQERQLQVVSIADFLAKELPPRENVLSPWLPCQGLAMIHAPRGIGKTHVALNIAYAVASGGDFLGWSAPKARRVLFLDGEMPASALQERLAEIVRASKIEAEPDRFHILTPDLNRDGMPDLGDSKDQDELAPLVEGVELIVVDNISTLCRTGKENEAEGWLPVQGWALRMRAAGRSVLFVHHSGKTGLQRGTSRREDVLDTVIALRRPTDYRQEQGARFEVYFEKARGIYGKEVEPFEAALTTDRQGLQVWGVKTVEACNRDRIATMLKDGMSQKDIALELGLSKSNVSYHAKNAKAEGRINGRA